MKLKKYIKEEGYTIKGFARKVHTTPLTIQRIMSEERCPAARLAFRIIRVTQGQVTLEDLVPNKFRPDEFKDEHKK